MKNHEQSGRSTVPEDFPNPELETPLIEAYQMARDFVEIGRWIVFSFGNPYVMENPSDPPIPAIFSSQELAKNLCSIMRKLFATGEEFAKLREKHSYKPNEIAHVEQITASNIEEFTEDLAVVLYFRWFAHQHSNNLNPEENSI